MSDKKPYDLLLRGGHVICPASEINSVMDVAIRDDQIVLPASAKEVVDVRGRLVLPGMIDTHAHVYRFVTGRLGLDADMVGVHSGVTTVIDQGGPSCMTLPGFRHYVAEPAKTRVYAFLSSYLVGGLEGHLYPSLYSPEGINIQATVLAANANLDLVRGIKGHAEIGGFARWGIKVLQMSAEIGRPSRLTKPPGWRVKGCARISPGCNSGNHAFKNRYRRLAVGAAFGKAPQLSKMDVEGELSLASLARRSIAASKLMWVTVVTSPIASRVRRSMPALSRIRSARTCTATTLTCRLLPARLRNMAMTKRTRSPGKRNSA